MRNVFGRDFEGKDEESPNNRLTEDFEMTKGITDPEAHGKTTMRLLRLQQMGVAEEKKLEKQWEKKRRDGILLLLYEHKMIGPETRKLQIGESIFREMI